MTGREGAVVLTQQLMLDVLSYPETFCSVERTICFVTFIFSFSFFFNTR